MMSSANKNLEYYINCFESFWTREEYENMKRDIKSGDILPEDEKTYILGLIETAFWTIDLVDID